MAEIDIKPPHGVYYVNYNNYNNILKYIKEIKPQVDILIMSIHWGANLAKFTEFRYRKLAINKYQKFAKDVFEAGVDIIHGHSSHHVKCIRWSDIKNKVLMYGVGDFVNNCAVNKKYRNDLGMIVKIVIKNTNIIKVSICPTKIENNKVNILGEGEEKDYVYNEVKKDCNMNPIDDSYSLISK